MFHRIHEVEKYEREWKTVLNVDNNSHGIELFGNLYSGKPTPLCFKIIVFEKNHYVKITSPLQALKYLRNIINNN